MRYPEQVIEEVRTRSDIVDIVGSYVRLEKKGRDYFGLCPFHNEKSPSFSVAPLKQMYYCFGCHAAGNVFKFVMDYENYTFKEAVELLAERAGITLPAAEMSDEDKRNEKRIRDLLAIQKEAAIYYYRQLHTPAGKLGLEYLHKRELSDETIRKFGLGYSPANGGMYRYLKGKGFSDERIAESGLVRMEEKRVSDKFWNRVMFPIMDVNNRVIGFGGRVMGDAKPKYLNSQESVIFDKSRNLFGLNEARKSREKYILLCEGYMDVISLHQAGFTNSVASLGTAFTFQQSTLLKRYTQQIILTYDSDAAGVNAALRAIPILKSAGLPAKILDMRPYKDPDEFIKNLGAEEFQKRIDNAENSFLFEIRQLRKQYQVDDPQEQTKFYHETAKKLLSFDEELERSTYLESVAREFMIPLEGLRKLVNQYGAAGYQPKELTQPALNPSYQNAHKSYSGTNSYAGRDRQTGSGRQAGGQGPASRAEKAQRPAGQQGTSAASRSGGQADASGHAQQDDDFTPFYPDEMPGVPEGYTPENYVPEGYTPEEDPSRDYVPEGYENPEPEMRREPVRRDPKAEKHAAAMNEAQKLLLTWISEEPWVYAKIEEIITPEDFTVDLYRRMAERLFAQAKTGAADPAAILSAFLDDEDAYEAGQVFQTKLRNELSGKERGAAFRDIVIRVKDNSLRRQSELATDANELMRIMTEKKALSKLDISLT